MRLYLVRHGKAERDSPTGRDDDRPLKPKGIRQSQWLGENLAAVNPKHRPGVVLSSPVVRALDTARILQRALDVPLEVRDELSTRADERAVLELIQAHASARCFLLVGHNPTLSMVVTMLATASSRPTPDLRTGECAVLALQPDGGLLGSASLVRTLRDEGEED